MSLTDEQNVFLKAVYDCQNGMICLDSPAGTGKSYCVNIIMKRMKSIGKTVVILAPTHKAKEVLIRAGCVDATTIHSFFKAKMDINEDGDRKFIMNHPGSFVKDWIIIVDEGSMITESMFVIFQQLAEYNTIIFTSDRYQLPPIEDDGEGSKLSPIFTNDIKMYSFTKNMRSKLYSATVMVDFARKAVIGGHMGPEINSMTINEILPYYDDDGDSIILAYSNKRVNEYNNLVRRYLFDSNSETLEPYYPMEVLLYYGCRIEDTKRYYSGSHVKVKSVDIYRKEFEYKICECDLNTEFFSKRCKKHLFRRGKVELAFYRITCVEGFEWFIPHKDTEKEFKLYNDQYRGLCKLKKNKQLWKEYHCFRDTYCMDLRYRYASTIYRCQGSQWSNVFIDRKNIIHCCFRDKLLKINGYYTAVSRVINEVYDINPNPANI